MRKLGSDDGSGGMSTPGPAAGPARSNGHWIRWASAALLLVIVGSACATLAASIQSTAAAREARQASALSSASVASSLTLAIQREEDLVVAASAFMALNPNASSARFAQWARSVQVLRRHPEINGLGRVAIVPAEKLAAYAATAKRDPTSVWPADGVFRVVPPGRRSFYCLPTGAVIRSGTLLLPFGLDYCPPGAMRRAGLASRDAGASAYLPIPVGAATWLAVQSPVYRGGGTPSTTAARRAAFLGWVGTVVVPDSLLARALADHPGISVTVAHRAGSSDVEFRRGTPPSGARSVTMDLRDGWTVRTFAAAPATGILAPGTPRVLLLAGIALSLLLGALVFLLGTGRARALRLVGLRTVELRHQALHDGLTGLPNRTLVTDRLEQLLARGRRNGTTGAVLFIDLDGFKNVNDTLGHEAGDELLRSVAARLTTGLRDVDTVGRLGGDEFVVLIDGEPPIAPELVAGRLLEIMRQPFLLDCSPEPVRVRASVGVAVGVRITPGELLRYADIALYRAKAAGGDCYEAFRPGMETALRDEIELERDLRSALDGDQFRLVYQPIYDLEDLSLVSVEALLRWDHPTLGVIEPDDFIPLLEASGQIVDVGRWVLTTACRQTASWHARGSTVGIAVNVSGRQLDDDAIVAHVGDALRLSALDPADLTIEITETVLMGDADSTARRLREIKALGVKVAIDDFGTGYSSLASLQRFPIDTIKIDRAFTDALERSPESDALIRILVQLGRDLGLTTLAEGVETLGQLDHLRHEHINKVQGFLLSKPLDAEAVEGLILLERAPHTPPTT